MFFTLYITLAFYNYYIYDNMCIYFQGYTWPRVLMLDPFYALKTQEKVDHKKSPIISMVANRLE